MAAIPALVVFLGGWLLLWLPIALVVARVLGMPWSYPISPAHKLPLLLPLYGVAPLAVWGYSQGRVAGAWADYGLVWGGQLGRALGVGFGIGWLGVVLLIMVELGLGWRRWEQAQVTPSQVIRLTLMVAGLLALTGFVGGVEELVFRGVLVQGLQAAMPTGAMVLLVSGLFAVSHLVWDGPAGIPSLPGLGLMGAVLVLARWVDGGLLGLPWGLHTGWIFAIAVNDTLGLTIPLESAPGWLAGKPDQPLTGLPALGLLGLTGLGLWAYYQGC